jgi:hypothetical protein
MRSKNSKKVKSGTSLKLQSAMRALDNLEDGWEESP